MGSGITYADDKYDVGCSTLGTRDCIPGAANIAQGVTFRMAATAEIAGGTTVWKSPGGVNMVQAEQLGAGFLFVCGDANVFAGPPCNYNNCAFAERLWTYEDSEIL